MNNLPPLNTKPNDLQSAVRMQRMMLTTKISRDMRKLSRDCVDLMADRAALEHRLQGAFNELFDCKHIYVLDKDMVQITSNISRGSLDESAFGRNRSGRPYMQGIVGTTNFALSQAYISRNTKRPSLTAVRVIRDLESNVVGFLGADYDLRELPATADPYKESKDWQQIKGDPSIRQNLFMQERKTSMMDDHFDDVMGLMNELILFHGVFHCKMHFSSSRASIWLVDDPYDYRLLSAQEILNPDTCLAYPHRHYTNRAIVPKEVIVDIFAMFKELRFADENVYLRSGSINVCNGMVALNFSCDGSHYIQYDKFLENGLEFWFGHVG